jgi:hypothetical protein
MIIYKWSIDKMITTGETNLVTHVYWRCEATDDNLISVATGIRNLTSSDSFTPYIELTEQQVLEWCFEPEVITLFDQTTDLKLLKDEVEAQEATKIELQLAQQQTEPALPWS